MALVGSTTKSVLGSIGNALLDLVLPFACPSCNKPVTSDCILTKAGFCEICWQSVLSVMMPCVKCGKPEKGPLCTDCSHRPPIFVSAVAPLLYGGQLTRAIHRAKYQGASYILYPLGEYLRQSLSYLPPCDRVVPMPLHRKRLRQRGYNQAALLARQLVKGTNLEVDYGLVRRRRDTQSQAKLDPKERFKNLEEAFEVRARAKVPAKVLVVDDVLTTGATASACASALLQAGAREVHILTLARAVP